MSVHKRDLYAQDVVEIRIGDLLIMLTSWGPC